MLIMFLEPAWEVLTVPLHLFSFCLEHFCPRCPYGSPSYTGHQMLSHPNPSMPTLFQICFEPRLCFSVKVKYPPELDGHVYNCLRKSRNLILFSLCCILYAWNSAQLLQSIYCLFPYSLCYGVSENALKALLEFFPSVLTAIIDEVMIVMWITREA